jgi:YggT family protein
MLRPIRKLLPNTGGLDFSPIVVIILIMVAQRILNAIIGLISNTGAV